jgi:hypothetical protein
MPHFILLGDSIFDNAAYVEPRHAVIDHLRKALPSGATVTLLARDGAVVHDVHDQVAKIPSGASRLFLSAGGNDALGHIGLLEEPARSMAGALDRLAAVGEQFEADYRRLLEAIAQTKLPTTVCTIYNGRLLDKRIARLARTALIVFNDVIVRLAFEHGLDVIELRLVCSSPADYANDIEPSSRGGERIAKAIAAGQFSMRAVAG